MIYIINSGVRKREIQYASGPCVVLWTLPQLLENVPHSIWSLGDMRWCFLSCVSCDSCFICKLYCLHLWSPCYLPYPLVLRSMCPAAFLCQPEASYSNWCFRSRLMFSALEHFSTFHFLGWILVAFLWEASLEPTLPHNTFKSFQIYLLVSKFLHHIEYEASLKCLDFL